MFFVFRMPYAITPTSLIDDNFLLDKQYLNKQY